MSSIDALVILARANAAITWAAAGDRERTASNWDALVRIVAEVTSKTAE